MSREAPKLYVNKPKKAQLKQFQQQVQGMDAQSSISSSSSSSSSSTAASSSIGSGHGSASKPPEVPKESFARRYKFLWPLLLTVNLAVGAYIFMRTKKKVVIEDETTDASAPTPIPSAPPTPTAVTDSPAASLPVIAQLPTVEPPIPQQQQRELFKWMLEEKRKIKTNNLEEKKRIDEEKAILKQFIRAKSIPTI